MDKVRGFYKDTNTINTISQSLLDIVNINLGNIVIVNIGTDKNIGDSLAPFVGTILKQCNINIPVYGTIENPIHALNMKEKIKDIKEMHPDGTIIAIDACIGKNEDIGVIEFRPNPIRAGKGLGKCLPSVGDYSIVGVIEQSATEMLRGGNIRISFILEMAKEISKIIIKSINDFHIRHKEIAV